MASNPKTWGYCLVAPGRRNIAEQRHILGALGVDTGETGLLWVDEIARGRPSRAGGQKQLSARNDALAALIPGDRLMIAEPFCAGISALDARWFVEAIWSRKAILGVYWPERTASDPLLPRVSEFRAGADIAELLAEISRRQNAANVAALRARRR